jgi:hypothetical protein
MVSGAKPVPVDPPHRMAPGGAHSEGNGHEGDSPDSVTSLLVCGVRAEFNPYGTRPPGALGTSSAQLRIGFG